jgi:hypothetical protein
LSKSLISRIDNHQIAAPLLDTYLKLGRAYQSTLGQPPPLSFEVEARRR